MTTTRADDFADSYPHPVLECDAHGALQYLNRAARVAFPELETRHRPSVVLHGLPAIVAMLAAGQTTIAREVTVQKTVYAQEFVRVPHSARYRIYMTDVTERKRLDQLKDEFISTVSHELRTPLTIIKGAISNLQDGIVGELTPMQQKVIATANRNVDRLTRIINDLLDLSRLESGHAVMHRRATDVAAILREVQQNFAVIVEESGLTCVIEPIPADCRAYADPDLLQQVVTNLVTNALRFARQTITLSVRMAPYDAVRTAAQLSPLQLPTPVGGDAACVVLTVSDDGPGIAEAAQEQLFSKFAQLNRPMGGAGYKGTGLGLAICRAIAEQHHGTIWYESNMPHGARFSCAVPAHHALSECWAVLESRLQSAEAKQQACAVLLLRHATTDADTLRQCEAVLRERIVRQHDDLLVVGERNTVCVIMQGGRTAIEHLLPRWEQMRAAVPGVWHAWHVVYPDDAPNPDAVIQAMLRAWNDAGLDGEGVWQPC